MLHTKKLKLVEKPYPDRNSGKKRYLGQECSGLHRKKKITYIRNEWNINVRTFVDCYCRYCGR